MKIIYFDTETTGLDCESDQIIELAMLVFEDEKLQMEYDEFVKIGYDLPLDITKITGITDEMLNEEGISEESVARDLMNTLTPGTLMIAHNCQFDLSFVYYLLKRHYPEKEVDELLSSLDWLDTLTVVKDRMKYPHRLNHVVKHYGIEEVNFHRAIDDTKALYEVTQALADERDDLEEYVNLFGFNPKYGVSGEEFSFIEYKEQKYNNWMVSPNRILPFR